MNNPNVLILGNGFIGNKLFSYLTDKFSTKILSRANLDYTNYISLVGYLRSNNYDYVINTSGYTGKPNVDAAEDDKETCWKLNVEVPATILNAVETVDSVQMIHISSGCVYNGYQKHWTEDDVPNFGIFNPHSSFYSKSKHAAETILKDRAAVLRIRIPFCEDRTPRNYFTKLLGYDDLISTPNSVTCVEDLCEFVSKILTRQDFPSGIWNVVNEGTLSADQVVECLAKHNIVNSNHRFIDVAQLKTKAKRSNCILSTEKIKNQLYPLPDVMESLERCVAKYALASS